MAVQSTTLHTDTAGKSTSAVYATDADGTDRWYLAVRIHGLEQAEDAPHTTGDAGIMPLAVRRDTAAASSGTTGDYEPLQTDALGRLRITGPVLEDAAAADGDAGFPMLAVRRDTAAAGSGTTGDYEALQTDALGRLRITGPVLEDAAAADGDAGFPMLAVRRDTAAAGSGTTGDYEALQTTATGALRVRGTGIPGYPEAATAVVVGSGVVANATATATMAAVASKTNYLAGFHISGGGATAASLVTLTVTGLLGGTRSFIVPVPAGVTAGLQPIRITFDPPVPASATNTAIVVSCPAFGAGNTAAVATAHGYVV